ncbi:MAG: hypothetical protein KDD44_00130 [Bdellovibrionales bacterium]|nr:hypothetical protein [Bdellovibrionales bacterium]
MTKLLPILRVEREVQPGAPPAVSFEFIQHDWFGAPLQQPAEFALVADPEWLVLVAPAEQNVEGSSEWGEAGYTEGLWHDTVVELFAAEKGTERYVELNLAPSGTWWGMCFSAPRTRSEHAWRQMRSPQVARFREPRNGRMVVALRIEFGSVCRNPLQLRANVCGVQRGAELQYYSWIKLPGSAPDFHQPESFAPCDFRGGAR